MNDIPSSIDDTAARLLAHDYVADRQLATVVYLALKLQRPLFLEGEPGTGKTEIARTLAAMLGRDLVRLQCYEGLDLAGAAYEWNYGRQMMEIRLAERDHSVSREALAAELFSERFLHKRALLQAIDPARSAGIDFSPPYVTIEGAYAVQQGAPMQALADVDKAGVRIAVGRNSAYDLFLTREIKAATLVRAPTSAEVVPLFLEQKLEVAAGVRQQLEADIARRPGVLRLLPGSFMTIQQAVGLAAGRPPIASATLKSFVEEIKTTGAVAEALRRHGIEGAAVAAKAP